MWDGLFVLLSFGFVMAIAFVHSPLQSLPSLCGIIITKRELAA